MKNNTLIALVILIIAGIALFIYYNKKTSIPVLGTQPIIDPDASAKYALASQIISECDYTESDRSSLISKPLYVLQDILANC